MIMKLWIAREPKGLLRVFKEKPRKHFKGYFVGVDLIDYESFGTPIVSKEFPELTYQNSPQQIELKLLIS